MSTRVIIIALVGLWILPCLARTITVDDNGPADFSNIQAAINDANNGDTVIVQPGTYTGYGNCDIVFLGKAIAVRSADPNDSGIVAATIVSCIGINHRGFIFVNNEGQNSILEGMTIANAFVQTMSEAGAGIYIDGSSPSIKKCIITNNYAELKQGSLGYCLGGGVYIEGECNPLITDCIISGNVLGDWGWGAGIYCANSAQVTIKNCLISNNTALGYDGTGGGVYCDPSVALTIVNCSIVDNLADQDGGGIYFQIYNSPARTITNSILWGNSPGQIYPSGNPNILVTYSDISGGWTGTGNIDADPCFVNPNGGDYHLQSAAGRWDPNTKMWVKDANTSLCIDAGDPNSDWTKELWPNGKRINMGAYGGTPEASMSLSAAGNIANLDNDPCDTVDLNDLALFVEKWCFEESPLAEDLDRNGHVDFADYAIFGNEYYESHPVEQEPEISYTISPCQQQLLQSSPAAQTDETRFIVTVFGRDIHFEDMMVANCCAQYLWLEMVVIDNLIIIYEHEYTSTPCFCICNYPVDARLGPFEEGTYTVEVYEDFGGFIGSLTVTIE